MGKGFLHRIGNGLDRIVSVYNPVHAVERRRARQVFNYYEAARPSQYRKQRRETGSANTAVNRAGANLREQARHAEQNHDIARNALAILVQNTIGPHGIGVEPQPRRRDGSIHQEFARQIREARRDWVRRPEVTWSHDWPSAERILARSWFRDGEVFAQHVEGTGRAVAHGTRVPYSLELLEADFVPFDYSRDNVVQGVQLNEWRRPVAFHVYRSHPADYLVRVATQQSLKTVPAARMLHCKLIDRIGQVRGVSVFASVLARLEDIKDDEESERIA
ncbi:MAG TPA: phage portal protein, partial [Arenicellales bacterium]|nr:phage portal protein [Arenicellales bacterium]